MELLLLLFIIAVGPLAVRYGVDSRLDEVENVRRWRTFG